MVKLYFSHLKQNLKSQLEYKWSFIMSLISQIFVFFTYYFLIISLFTKFNNIKKVDRLSSHKKNTSNTHQKKLNYKEIKDKVSSINQNIRVTNKFHTLNISKKEIISLWCLL